MSAPTVTSWVYDFSEGSREMRELLGGKGPGTAEMTRVLGPDLVPAGFTITTEACVAYMRGERSAPDGLEEAIDEALSRLESQAGRRLDDPRLDDPADPLLLSARSGARNSMPGMMDTVLNLGLNDESMQGLAAITGRLHRDQGRALALRAGRAPGTYGGALLCDGHRDGAQPALGAGAAHGGPPAPRPLIARGSASNAPRVSRSPPRGLCGCGAAPAGED